MIKLGSSHREAYPEQYNHSMCGKRVECPDGVTRTVHRVTSSRFGKIAMFEDVEHGYRIQQLKEV